MPRRADPALPSVSVSDMSLPKLSVEDSLDIAQATSSEDRAWAAGFFDGEGCFSSKKTRRGRIIQVSITQVDREVLDRFRAIVAVGSVVGPKTRPDGLSQRPFFIYRTTGSRAEHVFLMIEPYLGMVKRAQYLRALLK